MDASQLFLRDSIVIVEFLSAVIGIVYYNSLKNSFWKWFVVYLNVILLFELISYTILDHYPDVRKYYYGFLVTPFEFCFFYWLYAYNSLHKPKLFWISIGLYAISFFPYLLDIDNTRVLNSLNYTVGVLVLAIMVGLEFMKQIKSDEILSFKTNKMFYVNLGVFLFYIGTLPFFTFDRELYLHARSIWSNYLTYDLVVVNLMYILFAASFIWGKQKN